MCVYVLVRRMGFSRPCRVGVAVNSSSENYAQGAQIISYGETYRIMMPLGVSVVLIAIAILFGYVLLKVLFKVTASPEYMFVFSAPIGLGAIGYIVLSIGLCGFLNSFTASSLLLAIVFFSVSLLWRYRYIAFNTLRISKPSLTTVILIGFIAIMFLGNFIHSLAPATDADSLRHHLAAPKEYIRLKSFPFIPVFWWNAPGVHHVLNTMCLLFSNSSAVQMFVCLQGLILAVSIYAIGRIYFTHYTGLLAAAIFYCLPMTTVISSTSCVEFYVALCSLLAFAALLQAGDPLEPRWVVLCGILAGLAGATKFWGLLSLPALLSSLLVIHRKSISTHWPRIVSSAVILTVCFVAVLSPWLVRNYIAGGDPLWPYTSSIFPNIWWQKWQTVKFSRWTRGPGASFLLFLTGPWNLTNRAGLFNPDGRVLTSALLPPIILSFAPGFIFARKYLSTKESKTLLSMGMYCLTVYSVWFFRYQHPRYIQSLHPFLSLLAAEGIIVCFRISGKFLHAILSVLTIFSFIPMLALNWAFNRPAIDVVFNRVSQRDYLAAKVPFYESIEWVNNNIPPDAKVLFIGLQSFYYLERPLVLGVPAYQGIIKYDEYKSPESFLNKIKSLGITHIYFEGIIFNNASGLREAWDLKPAEYADEVAYHEWKPIELLVPLFNNGYLQEIYTSKGRQITSRTFHNSKLRNISVYAINYPK